MKLSSFRIFTPNVLRLRPLILFAVLSCFDWTFFACSVSMTFLLITFLRQSIWHSALKNSAYFISGSKRCMTLIE